eukprot:jgi/Galph1/3557/GphlegSOOS_G2209.1
MRCLGFVEEIRGLGILEKEYSKCCRLKKLEDNLSNLNTKRYKKRVLLARRDIVAFVWSLSVPRDCFFFHLHNNKLYQHKVEENKNNGYATNWFPGRQNSDLAIVWLRRELRLHDNPLFIEAAKKYRNVLPVFIYEKETESTKLHNSSSLSDCSQNLLFENLNREPDILQMCLTALRKQLKERNSNLLVIISDDATESLINLIEDTGAKGLFLSRGIFPQERIQEEKVKRKLRFDKIQVETFWTNTLHTFDSLTQRKDSIHDCDHFGKIVHDLKIPADDPAPEYLPSFPYDYIRSKQYNMDNDIVLTSQNKNNQKYPLFIAEQEALSRLTEFISSKSPKWIDHYPDAKVDTVYGRMNPFLSFGCISMRTIYRQVMESIPNSLRRYCVEMDLIFREFLMFRYLQLSLSIA